MRAFIAIDIPDDMVVKIAEIQEELKEHITGSFQKANFHLTLKFFGEIKETKEVISAMDSLKKKKFTIRFSGLGVFPTERYIRIIWLGITKGKQELEEINSLLEEKERYVPHLTIARVKRVKDKEKLLDYLKRPKELEEFQATAIHLYKSELSPEGAKHTKLHTVELS